MSDYRVLGFYLRVDIAPDGAIVSLFDIDDTNEDMPLAEATALTADLAVAELIGKVTFDVKDEGDI